MSPAADPRWGRNAGPETATTRAKKRFGRRSVLLALGALAIVVAAVAFTVNVPKDAPEPWPTLSLISVGAAYLLLAPLMHLAGLIYGFRGLFREGDSRLLSLIGILLNVGLVAAGIFLGLAALRGLTAFT